MTIDTVQASDSTGENAQQKPICGLIMPISATKSHSEGHWAEVQTLLHRVITEAGFEPKNVWENSAKDRVSERIIENIFKFPMIVADISDLNPNVMLELGLRLASKKPTQVIVNSGGDIPFDIRDFHAIGYPSNTSMIAMEEFFEVLKSSLKIKYQSSLDREYIPFLGNIVVDVLSPEQREVSADQLIMKKLDEISRRISFVETASERIPMFSVPQAQTKHTVSQSTNNTAFNVPVTRLDDAVNTLVQSGYSDITVIHQDQENAYIMAGLPRNYSPEQQKFANLVAVQGISNLGGNAGIPVGILELAQSLGKFQNKV